jgi:hypothetical protein
MFAAYLVVTLVAAIGVGATAAANLIGHEYPRVQADRNRIPRTWVRPLGIVLAAGAVGLLGGFVVPALGILAAAGLVLYFLGAFAAHVRARNYQLGPWAVFFCLTVATLAVQLAWNGRL